IAGGDLALNVEATENSVTFNVPSELSLGMQEFIFIFPGNERARASIEVVPLPAIFSFTPFSAAEGETVTLIGANLDRVTGVKVATTDATILSQTPNALKFSMPAGAQTGKIMVTST